MPWGIFPLCPFINPTSNMPYHDVILYSNYPKPVCNEVTTGSRAHQYTEKHQGKRRSSSRAFPVSFGSSLRTCVSLLQVVYWRLVGVWEDVRRRDQDEDGSVYQEDQPR